MRPDRRVGLVVRLGRRLPDVRAAADAIERRRRRRPGWTAVHHPFTSPEAGVDRPLRPRPDEALAYAYDIVCNGNEIGGGSIRIHRGDVQQRVFDLHGLSREEAEDKFGFLLEAFAFGAAAARRHRLRLGPDLHAARRAASLREVIAFPKTGGGLRPAHRGADADHRRAAQGGRHRLRRRAGRSALRRREDSVGGWSARG